jgi:uncharacterized membrane protein
MRKSVDAFGLLALAALIWITYTALNGPNRLPERMPTHFDVAGNPNGWGSPSGIILIPIIASGVYLLMSVVARFPASFNYPVRVTPQTLPRLQAITLDMITWIKAEMACLFAALQWAIIQAARSSNGQIFPKILPFFLIVVFGTVAGHIVALFRAARGGSDSSRL